MSVNEQIYNILVVEDNIGDFVLIEDYIREKMKHPKILQAKSFAETTEILGQNSNLDVILLDLSLPDISGEELVKRIRNMVEHIPIIVLTGYAQKNFGVKTLSLGVSDYLLKDEFTATELYKSIVYSIERIRVSSKLVESEKKYRHIFHSSPLPMWVCEVNSLRFLDVNDAAIKHYGYSRDEFLSMSTMDIISKEIEDSQQSVLQHKIKSGEIISVEIQSNVIFFDGIKAELVLANDITDKLKYEEKLKRSEHALRKLNKELEKRVSERTAELVENNKELEMFNYAVSHELRAPLRFINFCLQSIISNSKLEGIDSVYDIIKDMNNASLKMYRQLEDLLAFSKVGKQALKFIEFNIEGLIGDVLESLQPEYDLSRYTINIDVLESAFGDKNLLFHVFQNLLSNALKYSAKVKKPLIEVSTENKSDELIFKVKDNGIGFDMKFYPMLFDCFERLHSDDEFIGSGAGLTIAQRVIQRHGGEIWAESKQGEGAIFYFSLPKNPAYKTKSLEKIKSLH